MIRQLLVGLVVATGVFAAPAVAKSHNGDDRGVLAAASPAKANDAKTDEVHTVTFWCVDLNELWHLDVPVIVGRADLTTPDPSPVPPCPTTSTFPIQVPAGSGWSAAGTAFWETNNTYPPAVRAALETVGYNFASSSPMEDFMQKIVEVRFVVWNLDFDTPLASFSFDPRKNFRLVRTRELYGALPIDPIVDPTLGIDLSIDEVGRLPMVHFSAVGGGLNLPTGVYWAELVWVLAELHNDGLGLDPAVNFVPAGVVSVAANRFAVVQ